MIYKTLIKPVSSEYYPSTGSITWVLPNYSVPGTQKTSECTSTSLFLTYIACIQECSTIIRVSAIWFFSDTRLCGEGADLPICWRPGIHFKPTLWSFRTKWLQLSDHFWTTWWQIDQGGQSIQSIPRDSLRPLFFRLQHIASFEFYEHVSSTIFIHLAPTQLPQSVVAVLLGPCCTSCWCSLTLMPVSSHLTHLFWFKLWIHK